MTYMFACIEPLPWPASSVHQPCGEDKEWEHAQCNKCLPDVDLVGRHLFVSWRKVWGLVSWHGVELLAIRPPSNPEPEVWPDRPSCGPYENFHVKYLLNDSGGEGDVAYSEDAKEVVGTAPDDAGRPDLSRLLAEWYDRLDSHEKNLWGGGADC